MVRPRPAFRIKDGASVIGVSVGDVARVGRPGGLEARPRRDRDRAQVAA
jgi:hypothetical protein